MQRRCSDCGGGYFCLVAVRLLTFIKCYYYHITESIQILSKTEVVAMIRRAQMLQFRWNKYKNIYQTLLLLLRCRHVTIQMKGSRCQPALQIEDGLHVAEQTSVSLNMEACQALQVLGWNLSLSFLKKIIWVHHGRNAASRGLAVSTGNQSESSAVTLSSIIRPGQTTPNSNWIKCVVCSLWLGWEADAWLK